MRIAVALAVVGLLAGFSAGCGGDDADASSAAAWADAFCTSTQEWRTELQRIGDEISDVGSLSQETIEQAVEDARDATDEYVDDVRALGAPETESGAEVEESVEQLADDVEAEKEEAEEALEGAEGLAGYAQAGQDVAASVSAMFAAIQQTLTAIGQADVDGELETAFEESDACDEIAN